MPNTVKETEYRLVFDVYATSNKYLCVFENLEQARKYRDAFNTDEGLLSGYGAVHIEKVVITKEVID